MNELIKVPLFSELWTRVAGSYVRFGRINVILKRVAMKQTTPANCNRSRWSVVPQKPQERGLFGCVFWVIWFGHTELIQGITNLILFHHSQNYNISPLQTSRLGSIGYLQSEWVWRWYIALGVSVTVFVPVLNGRKGTYLGKGVPVQAMKAYRELEVWLHVFLTGIRCS
jgi:hypothetical protein